MLTGRKVTLSEMNLSKLNIIVYYHFPHGELNDNGSKEVIVDALRLQSFLYRRAMQSDEGAVKATSRSLKFIVSEAAQLRFLVSGF